jgi:Oxidoreductase molybdopterin binding domain
MPALSLNVLRAASSILLCAAIAPAQQPTMATTAGPSAVQIVVGGKAESVDGAVLAGKPRKTVTVTNAHTKNVETYSGVLLADLLTGAPLGTALHGKALATYVLAEGADHYRAVLSLAEVDPSFHSGDVLLADSIDGKPIGDKEGPFKLIVSEDKRPARWVRNLSSITVVAAP